MRRCFAYRTRAYVTKTLLSPKADTYFPNLDKLANWSIIKEGPILEENGIRFQYLDYVNSTPPELPK